MTYLLADYTPVSIELIERYRALKAIYLQDKDMKKIFHVFKVK